MAINISGILKTPQGSAIQNAEIIFEQTRTSTEVLAGTKFSVITNQTGNYSSSLGVGIYVFKVRFQEETQYRTVASNVIVTQAMNNYTLNQIIQDQSQLEDVDYDLLQDVIQARDQAAASAQAAQTSQFTATTKASEASSSAQAALASKDAAWTSEANALSSKNAAQTSQTNAANSQTAAATSQTTATTKATEASNSAQAALTSKNAAQTSEANALASKNQAASSAQDALSSKNAAQTSQSTASTKATEAASSQTNASNSQTTATTKAGEASTSQTNAANSQTTATTKAGDASSSQMAAAGSQSTATTKATEATNSATLAQKWAANPENSIVSGGLYSALHYAAKAAQSAQTATGQLVWRGGWSAQAGTAPPTPTGTTQDFYRITQAGTILSVQYEIGDYIHWDNINSIWFKMDGTDSVTSVNGRTGAVVVTKTDVGLSAVNNWGASSQTNNTSTTTYATTAGVKAAYDLAATKLDATANAVSATKLATPRTINGTNFDGTANITTQSWGASRNLTVGNTAKAVDGSSNVTWTLQEIGAAPDGYGLGGAGRNLATLSCDTALESGFYGVYGTTTETPFGTGPSGSTLIVTKWGGNGVSQTFYSYTSDRVFVRRMYQGVWQPWFELYSTSKTPTPTEVGALQLSGGILSGSLTIQNSAPQLWFQETDNSDQKWALVADGGGFRLNKDSTSITDQTVVFRVAPTGELELNNPVSRTQQKTTANALTRYDYVNSQIAQSGAGTGVGTQPDATTVTGGVRDFDLVKTTGTYKVEGSWANGVDNTPTQVAHGGILEVQQRFYDNLTIQRFNYVTNTAGVTNLRTYVRVWANSTEGWSPWTTSGEWESTLTYRQGILRRNNVTGDDSVYPYVSYTKEKFRDTIAADVQYTIGEISFRAGSTNRYDPHSGDQMSRIIGQVYNTNTQGQYEGGLYMSSRVRNTDGSVADTSILSINRQLGAEFTHAGKKVKLNAGNVTAENFYQNTPQDTQSNALTRVDWVTSKVQRTIVAAAVLTTADNLDDIKIAGVYRNSQNATAGTQGLNYPVARAGTLVVLEGAGVTQRYYVYNSSEVYSRGQYSSGAWTPWVRDYNEQFKPSPADIGAAPSGFGLGDVQAFTVGDLDSDPLTWNGGKMGWIRAISSSTGKPNGQSGVGLLHRYQSGASSIVHVLFFGHDNKTYTRSWSGTAWSAWKSSFDSTNKPAIADVTGLSDALALAGGKPVLAVDWVQLRAAMWDGYVAGDGGVFKRADYPDAWAAIAAGKVPVVTDAEWLADPKKRGAFTTGDGSTTFRIPDYNGKYAGSLGAPYLTGDGANMPSVNGSIQTDRIRAAIGSVVTGSNQAFLSAFLGGSGVFATSDSGIPANVPNSDQVSIAGAINVPKGTGSRVSTLTFDLSRAMEVGSDTRPLSLSGCWAVKLFSAVQNVGSIDAAGLATQLAQAQSRISELEAAKDKHYFYGRGFDAVTIGVDSSVLPAVSAVKSVRGITQHTNRQGVTVTRKGRYRVTYSYDLEPTGYAQNTTLAVYTGRSPSVVSDVVAYRYTPPAATTVMAPVVYTEVFSLEAGDDVYFRISTVNGTNGRVWRLGYFQVEEL